MKDDMSDMYSEGLVCRDCSRLFGGYLDEGRTCPDCQEKQEIRDDEQYEEYQRYGGVSTW